MSAEDTNMADGGADDGTGGLIPIEDLDMIRRMVQIEAGGYGDLSTDRCQSDSGGGNDYGNAIIDLINDSDDEDDDESDDDENGEDASENKQGQSDRGASNHRNMFDEYEKMPDGLMEQTIEGKFRVAMTQQRGDTFDDPEVLESDTDDDNDDLDEGTKTDGEGYHDVDDGGEEDLTASEDRRIGRELLGFEQEEGVDDKDDEDLVDGTIGDGELRNTTKGVSDWSSVASLVHTSKSTSGTNTTTKFEVGEPYRIRGGTERVWIWRFASSTSAYGAKERHVRSTFLGAQSQLNKQMFEDNLIVNKRLFDEEENMSLPFEYAKTIRKKPYELDDLHELDEGFKSTLRRMPEWTYTRRVKILSKQQDSDNSSSSYRFGYYYQPLPPVLEESPDRIKASDEINFDSVPETQLPSKYGYLSIHHIIPARKGLRRGERNKIRVMELFVGFGGMHQGFKTISVFEHAVGVELDPSAVLTFRENYPNDRIDEEDVGEFLQKAKDDPVFREGLGRIDHLHVSPPCQGFSGANRNGGRNDEKNNNLSLIVVQYIKLFNPDTVSFENVEGMWRGKHVHYLRWILKALLQCGYQFHWDVLKACDYGDPQTRRRLIIMASKLHIPVPALPSPTHGKAGKHGTALLPYVTVWDVLEGMGERKKRDKYDGLRQTTPGQSKKADAIVLDPNRVAPALRATGPPVFHPFEDRALTVREYLALFSHDPENFRVRAKKRGNSASQYRQIGNSVPVKLAEALARSVADVLRYEWRETEAPIFAINKSLTSTTSSATTASNEQPLEVEEDVSDESSQKLHQPIKNVSDDQMLDSEASESATSSIETQP